MGQVIIRSEILRDPLDMMKLTQPVIFYSAICYAGTCTYSPWQSCWLYPQNFAESAKFKVLIICPHVIPTSSNLLWGRLMWSHAYHYNYFIILITETHTWMMSITDNLGYLTFPFLSSVVKLSTVLDNSTFQKKKRKLGTRLQLVLTLTMHSAVSWSAGYLQEILTAKMSWTARNKLIL